MTKSYTYDEVYTASLDYFAGDQLAAEVFAGKYALRDENDNILELKPSAMHRRLSREFARIEASYPSPLSEDDIYNWLSDWSIIPQGSPMAAIGNTYQYQSLSNCFVIDSPYDSYGGIMKTDEEETQIMKRRGGVGFDVSSIRPRGLRTSNAARTTDGLAVFMQRYSNSCREVAQGGRRGALMLTLDVHHPEVRTFINIKRDTSKVTGANISLRLSDEFMNAVKEGGKVHLRFPVDPNVEHTVEDWVDARELWHELVQSAWECAEPGLLFWDTVKKTTPTEAYASLGYGSTSTNPCGEIVLSPYDSCRLLLVNLTKFVNDPYTSGAEFDIKRFDQATQVAQRLMDDLVDLELEAVDRILAKIDSDPEPEDVKYCEKRLWEKIQKTAKNGRRTGLGITGLGDTLAALGIRYGSDDSIEKTGEIYRALALGSYRSSVKMAEQRGAFPVYDHGLESDHVFIKQIMAEDSDLARDYALYGRRNIANTTTPPAGSVSIEAQTTSGCEPVFRLKYDRWKKITENDVNAHADRIDDMGDRWQKFEVQHHGFKQWMDVTGKTYDDVEESPYWKATSNDIDWVKKIDMQAAAQKWICHSISNTTNIPSDAPMDIAKQIYMRGWESGCKGVTIYRDGTRDGVLTTGDAEETDNRSIALTHAPRRPKSLLCDIHNASVKGEQYVVLVGLLDDRPYEIFCGLSEQIEIPKKSKRGLLIKNGKVNGVATYNLSIPIGDDDELLLKNVVEIFDNPTYGAFSRALSLALRHGVPVQYITEQLRKDKNSDMTSFNRVIARILGKAYIVDGTNATGLEKHCSECSSDQLAYQSGCVTCMNCGASRCG